MGGIRRALTELHADECEHIAINRAQRNPKRMTGASKLKCMLGAQ